MIIEYKKPWTINPDPISYGMNSGKILSFNNSKEFTFHINFELIEGQKDEVSNIVWKEDDELGIQFIRETLLFTYRTSDEDIVQTGVPVPNEKVVDIIFNTDGIYLNKEVIHKYTSKPVFKDTSTINLGGGHSDNIEYKINKLSLHSSTITEVSNIDTNNPTTLGCYNFEQKTEEKVMDLSTHYNLLNRFYL